MLKVREIVCPADKLSIKCPFKMTPTRIVIHNTANDAPAENEIRYMQSNAKEVSFHFAVDDKEIVQGISIDRNAWHAGDGRGKGNMEGIAIEICYSKSGGERFEAAQKNAAEFTAQLLKKYGWGIDKVTKHQDYSGKTCPHRTLEYGWDNFLALVKGFMEEKAPTIKAEIEVKTVEDIAREVMAGDWGNGDERKQRLTAAGIDYNTVQAKVNELLGQKSTTPAKKSNAEIAKEVIAGKWGNGAVRKKRLKDAGYNYSAIQKLVNKMMK